MIRPEVPPGFDHPRIDRSIRVMAKSFADKADGTLPQTIHLFLEEADQDPQIEFMLMKDGTGFYYESTYKVKMDERVAYIKVYLE